MVCERIILDCDPGVDDSIAILLGLASPDKLKIDAITIVMGNHNDLDLLANNACLLLQMCNMSSDIPVIKGASKPLAYAYHGHSGIEVHAQNGIGNIKYPVKDLNRNPLEQYKGSSAAQFIVQHVLNNPDEITLCAIGPLTNIALAVSIGGEKFIKSVKRVVLMGGSVGGLGNKTAAAEANLANDPHAGRIVFDAFNDITMVGLNCTRQLSLTEEIREKMRKLHSIGQFCYDITTHYTDILRSWKDPPCFNDPTAIMYLIRPDIFEGQRACVDVEDSGRLTSGQTVADWTGRWKRPLQTFVLMKVNQKEFEKELLDRLAQLAMFKPTSENQFKRAEEQIEASET
jgi:inosine-uridine nucleoside N-ribohydrolase